MLSALGAFSNNPIDQETDSDEGSWEARSHEDDIDPFERGVIGTLGAPHATWDYNPDGTFVYLPLRLPTSRSRTEDLATAELWLDALLEASVEPSARHSEGRKLGFI